MESMDGVTPSAMSAHGSNSIEHSELCGEFTKLPRWSINRPFPGEQFSDIQFMVEVNPHYESPGTCICLARLSRRQLMRPDKITRAENTWCGHPTCMYISDDEARRVGNDAARLQTRRNARRDYFKTELEIQKRERPELQVQEDMQEAVHRASNMAAYKEDLLKPENQTADFHVLDLCKLADGNLDQVLPGLLFACTPTPSPTPTPSGEMEPDDCIICSEPMMPDEEVVHLPCSRKHSFHRRCIINYLKLEKKCPFCRTQWQIYCFGGFGSVRMGTSLTSMLPPDSPYRQPFMIQVGGYVRDGARESEQRQMLRFESTAALADIWGERNDPEALQQERAEWQREQKLRIASWETRLEETTTELSELMEEQRRDLAVLRRLWADLSVLLGTESPALDTVSAMAEALALELRRGRLRLRWLEKKGRDTFALRDTIENLLEPGEYGVLAQVGYIWRERRGDVNAMRMVLRARGTWTSSLGVSQRNFSNLRRLQDDVDNWIKTAREKCSLDLGAIRQRAKELVNTQLKNESQAIAERAQERARDIFTRQQPAAAAQQQPGEQRADGQPDLDIDADIDQQLEVAAQELDAEEDR